MGVNLYITLLVILTFGPYVLISPPIRTEQIYIYVCGIIYFFIFLYMRISEFNKYLLIFILLQLFPISIMFTVTLFHPQFVSFTKAISHAENYIENIVLSFSIFISYYISKADKYKFLETFLKSLKILLVLVSINSIVSILILLGLDIPMERFIGPANSISSSVWGKSLSMGRINGIFNQPFDAGNMYSLALLSCILLRELGYISYKEFIVYTSFILIGGILTISKVFLFLGVPLSLLLYLVLNEKQKIIINILKLVLLVVFSSLLMYVSLYTVEKLWKGSSYLLMMFSLENIKMVILERIFGGEYGINDWKLVLEDSPIFGEGFAFIEQLDSNYLEYFVEGGLVALMSFISLFIFLAYIFSARIYSTKSLTKRNILYFSFFVVILMFLSAFGAPSFTGNRIQVIYTLILTSSLIILSKGKGNET